MGAFIESLESHLIYFTFHYAILKFSAWILNLAKNKKPASDNRL
jgi:hypothetical protein